MEPVHSEHDLLDLAARLIAAVGEPIAVARAHVRIGASVGVAIGRDGSTDADAFFAEADTAAYRAKARGRGRAEVFDEALRLQLNPRAELEAAIAHGLVAGEMHVAYQPVVDVATGRLTGYEALIRWERPGVGPVPPDEFIPVAESSGSSATSTAGCCTRPPASWRVAGGVPGRAGRARPDDRGEHLRPAPGRRAGDRRRRRGARGLRVRPPGCSRWR